MFAKGEAEQQSTFSYFVLLQGSVGRRERGPCPVPQNIVAEARAQYHEQCI